MKNTQQREFSRMLEQDQFDLALRELYILRHPVITQLFPKYSGNIENEQSFVPTNEQLTQLHRYIERTHSNDLTISLYLLAIGTIAVLLAIIVFYWFVMSRADLCYSIIGLMGLPFLKMAYSGFRRNRSWNYGIWYEDYPYTSKLLNL